MVKIMENPIKMDDLGVPPFQETPISTYNLHENLKSPSACRCHVSAFLRGYKGHQGLITLVKVAFSVPEICMISTLKLYMNIQNTPGNLTFVPNSPLFLCDHHLDCFFGG